MGSGKHHHWHRCVGPRLAGCGQADRCVRIEQHAASLKLGGDGRCGLCIVDTGSRPIIGQQFETIPADRHGALGAESSHEFGDGGTVATVNLE